MITTHIITDSLIFNKVDSILMFLCKYLFLPITVNLLTAFIIFLIGLYWKNRQLPSDQSPYTINQAIVRMVDKII